MNKDKELIEEERENIEQYEGHNGYAIKAILSPEQINKIRGLNLNQGFKPSNFKILAKVFSRNNVVIHEYHELEKVVDVCNKDTTIKLHLLTKEVINRGLGKVNRNKIEKIQYVHLTGVQIMIKSLFRNGINLPITISLHDSRFLNPQDSHLGTVNGNLIYQKILFTCYPNYCIFLQDQNIDETLTLYIKLHRNNVMKEDSKLFTIHYSAFYSYLNSNKLKPYDDKKTIEIHEACRDTIADLILPELNKPMLQV